MKRIATAFVRLMVGILVMLLIVGAAVPVYAYGEGDASTYVAHIPVFIANPYDSKVKIEQLEGPRTKLPSETEIEVDENGAGAFDMTFADAVEGEVYKYRIAEVPGTMDDVEYNIEEKTYICEVWIFHNSGDGTVYARSFLYESDVPLDMTDEDNGNIPKPDECRFVNRIAADPTPPTPIDATSRGRKGETQASDGSADTVDKTGEVRFVPGSSALTAIQFVDPYTGEATNATEIDALDASGRKVGVYRIKDIDLTNGTAVVEFVPEGDFTGSPIPADVQVTDANGLTAVATYTPYVLVPPEPVSAETWGEKGETQSSQNSQTKVLFRKGDGRIVSMQLLDPYTGEPVDDTEVDALDAEGNVIGKYRLIGVDLDSGVGTVEFIPDPDFVGDPQPCGVTVVDEFGYVATAWYQPHVTDPGDPEVTPTDTPTPIPTGRATRRSSASGTTPGGTTTSQATTAKTGDTQKTIFFMGSFIAAFVVLMVVRRRRHEEE